jgi:hypothetical protein
MLKTKVEAQIKETGDVSVSLPANFACQMGRLPVLPKFAFGDLALTPAGCLVGGLGMEYVIIL